MIAAVALCLLMAQGAAAAGRLITLTPHARRGTEQVLRVETGVLRRGIQIDVYANGALIGSVSPFAIRGGHAAGTYSIPLRAADVAARRLRIRLVLTEPGKPDRAPTAREVRSVSLAGLPVE